MAEHVENKPSSHRLALSDDARVEHVARLALRSLAIAREVHEGVAGGPWPPKLVAEHLTRPWARRTNGTTLFAIYGNTPGSWTHLVEGEIHVGARWSVVFGRDDSMTILRNDLEVAEEKAESVEAAMARAGQADEVVERFLSMSAQLDALRAELGFAFRLLLPSHANGLHTAWTDCEWSFAPAGHLACVAVYLGRGKIEQIVGHVSTLDGWTIVLTEDRPYLLRESKRMRPEGPDADAVTAVLPTESAPRSCRGCKFSGTDPDCEPFCLHPKVMASNAYGLVLHAAVRDYCGEDLSLFEPAGPREDESCR